MTQIKILLPDFIKCKFTYSNVLEALNQTDKQADVIKIEDIEEMMKYNVLTTLFLMIDEVIKVKSRVTDVIEIKELLNA